MPAKIIESKFVIKGEDQASPKVNKVSASLDSLISKLTKISKISILEPQTFERLQAATAQMRRDFEAMAKISRLPPPPTRQFRVITPQAPPQTRQPITPPTPTTQQLVLPGFQQIVPTAPPPPAQRTVRVFVINWPASLTTGPTGPGPRQFRPNPPQPATQPGWLQWLMRGPQTVLQAGAQGVPGIGNVLGVIQNVLAQRAAQAAVQQQAQGGWRGLLGAITGKAGFLGGAAGIGMAAGGVGAVGMALMLAQQMAQRGIQYEQEAAPMYHRVGRGRVGEARRFGVQYGFTPEEAVGLQRQLYAFGGERGFEATAQMRMMGLEPEEAVPYMRAVTIAGGAGGRTREEYAKLAKEIAIAIADKTKLPSVVQYMEQLTGLTAGQQQYLADMDESSRLTLVGLSKWGEESKSALFKGSRGAQTWGAVQNWLATSQNPATQVALYQVMNRNPAIREKMGVQPGRPMRYWEFQKARETPEAILPFLGELVKGYGGGQAGIERAAMAMEETGLSANIREKIAQAAQEAGGQVGKFKELVKEKTDVDIKTLMSSEVDLRVRQAQISEQQLQNSQKLVDTVMEINSAIAQVMRIFTPVLEGIILPLKGYAEIVNLIGDWSGASKRLLGVTVDKPAQDEKKTN